MAEQNGTAAPSVRTRVRMHAERARYGADEVYAVLDAGLVAHVALVDEGAPVVLPMAYGRIGDQLYLHGGGASRLLRMLGDGAEACATVTLLDGLVLARSAFKHSMNYRSVVVHDRARAVTEPGEVLAALAAVTDHNLPGRWASLRPPTRRELAATRVVAMSLTEAAVKVREGGPLDDPTDLGEPAWAGVLPLRLELGEARPQPESSGPPPAVSPTLRTK